MKMHPSCLTYLVLDPFRLKLKFKLGSCVLRWVLGLLACVFPLVWSSSRVYFDIRTSHKDIYL